MWLFTRYGFFSAVCARQGAGEYSQPVDPKRVMVRARLREHLEALRERFAALLGQCPIHQSQQTDYAYRLFVDKSVWAEVLAALAEEMDYDNFKAEVAHHQGPAGTEYEHALHEVWAVMYRLQR